MKRKDLISLAVAGALGFSASAFAGMGKHHGSLEVATPSAVSESAPWLTGQPHLAGWRAALPLSTAGIDYSLGAGHDFSASASEGHADTLASSDFDSDATGMSSSEGGFGAGSFSSSAFESDSLESSGLTGDEHATAETEVYVVPAPLAEFDGSGYWTEEIASAEELERVMTDNVYVMTPIYEDIIDPSMVLSEATDTADFGESLAAAAGQFDDWMA